MTEKKLPFTREFMEEIINNYPTPFHIYDEKCIRENAQRLKQAFSWHPDFKQYFALKATPNPNILKILSDEGFGLDCSSMAELILAEQCGLSGEEVVFSSIVPPAEEFQKARDLGVLISLDDISHIEYLKQVASIPEIMCLRYNPGDLREGNNFLGQQKEAKFGSTRKQLFEGYRILKEMGVKRFGIHTMIGTQVLNPDYMVNNVRMLLNLVSEISNELDIRFEFINIGGGIGIPYHPDERTVDLDYIGKRIKKVYQEKIDSKGLGPLKLFMECGRMITGPSGYLVSRVLHKKNIYKQYIGIDASMANLMRAGMYGEYHHITVLGKETLPQEYKYDVMGSICENNDKFAIDRLLPEIEIGDLIVIHDTGAHGHTMGFNYNGRLRSAELLLRAEGEVLQIRRAETIDDYFSTICYEMIDKGDPTMPILESIKEY